MAVQWLQASAPSSLLRRALLGNAAFSLLFAVVCLLDAPALAAWTGIQPPFVFTVLGVLILPFAVGMGWLALRVADLRSAGRVILALDVAWVAVSVVLLLTGWLPLTDAGWWTVALVADVVALFAVLEYLGLRRLSTAQGGTYAEPTRA
ncbi:MAG: hypothetical protein DCC55_26125 [Chloroflexi bacterium]|nr:MAG: hypothetical protein DCC55_26125 [Chloroflexota bacterium]